MAKLSWPAEVLYRRVMSVVDDFGRFTAHPTLLRAACYPLQLEKVSDADVGKWLLETEKAGLVSVYPASDGKRYLELRDFRQQIRSKTSKWPPPDEQLQSVCTADAKQLLSKREANVYLDVDGDVDGDEGKTLSGKNPDAPSLEVSKLNGNGHQAREILDYLNRCTGHRYEPVKANLELIAARLKEGFTPLRLKQIVQFKVSQWEGDEKMSPYLRPATLFNRTKFAQYDGEVPKHE